MKHLDKIEDLIKGSNFSVNNSNEYSVMILTRENGNVGTETASQTDINDGILLIEHLKANLVGCTFSIDEVDEWVYIEVIDDTYLDTYKPKNVGFKLVTNKSDYIAKGYTNEQRLNSLRDLVNRFIFTKNFDEVLEISDNQTFINTFTTKPTLIQSKHNDANIPTTNVNFCIERDLIKYKEIDAVLLRENESAFFEKYPEYDEDYFSWEFYVELISAKNVEVVPNENFYIVTYKS